MPNIVVMLLEHTNYGTVAFLRLVHPLNAFSPMLDTLSGMTRLESLLHPLNASDPMSVALDNMLSMLDSLLQP